VDGCDFFLQDGTQFFFLKRGGAANLQISAPCFLRLPAFDKLTFAGTFLWPFHIHRALASQVRHARACHEGEEKNSLSHLNGIG